MSAISQCTNSTRGSSAGTVRPGWFMSSPRLGTSGAVQVSRCGLWLSDSVTGASAAGWPKANVAGIGWPEAKLSLRNCMASLR